MNIFILDKDVKKCAQYHVDKHVVKMILETAQLLCGVHHMLPEPTPDVPYKLSHKNTKVNLYGLTFVFLALFYKVICSFQSFFEKQ